MSVDVANETTLRVDTDAITRVVEAILADQHARKTLVGADGDGLEHGDPLVVSDQ